MGVEIYVTTAFSFWKTMWSRHFRVQMCFIWPVGVFALLHFLHLEPASQFLTKDKDNRYVCRSSIVAGDARRSPPIALGFFLLVCDSSKVTPKDKAGLLTVIQQQTNFLKNGRRKEKKKTLKILYFHKCFRAGVKSEIQLWYFIQD